MVIRFNHESITIVVNGGWTEWTVYPCTSTCGRGVVVKNRTCTNPIPRYNGLPCKGNDSHVTNCSNLPKCPSRYC